MAEGGFSFASEIAQRGYSVTHFLGQHGRAKDWARRYIDFYMAAFGGYSFALPAYWRFTKAPSRFLTEELAVRAFTWLAMRADRSSTIPGEPTSRELRTLYDAIYGIGRPIAFKCSGKPLTLANADESCIPRLPARDSDPIASGSQEIKGASKSARRRARARARVLAKGTASSQPPDEGEDVA